MTEKSYVWDGVITGDATLAPYTKETFNKYAHLSLLSSSIKNYVVPAYLNDLKVAPAGSYLMAVKIGSGAAVFNNYVYELDSDTSLSIIRPTSGYRRIDYVILRLYSDPSDSRYQTVRLAILQGAETSTAYPVAPTLTQNTALWEVALAQVVVDDPAIYTYIPEGNVHDLREFAITDKSKAMYDGTYNLVKNSEFMAYTGGGSVSLYPEHWFAGGFTTLGAGTRLPSMMRGQSMAVTGGTLAQYIAVDRGTKTFTVRATINRFSATTIILQVFGIRSTGVTTTKYIKRNISYDPGGTTYPEATDYKETFTFEEDDIDYLYLTIPVVGGPAYIGQVIIVPGYHPGPYREFHETIPFRTAITDAAWSSTAKSSGTTTISLSASFSGVVLPGTHAVMLRVRGRDSGSAAGTPSLSIQGYAAPFNTYYGSLLIGGVTNDVWREMQIIVPVWNPLWYAGSSVPQFRAVVVSTGAATFDATLEIVGIIT